jgi:CheY-like chemotaxis protein
MKILVAEDNAVTATLVKGILTRHGYTVVQAKNGLEAMHILASEPGIQGVITDIMMPESSGLDLLRAMRENDSWREIPTIVTTVRDDPETVAEAVHLGCKGYVLKPVRPAHLLERVVSLFGQEGAVLRDSQEIIRRYSLNEEGYRQIAVNFGLKIDAAVARLQSCSSNRSPVRREEFIPIVECATLLGAERLLAVLDDVSTNAGTAEISLPMRVRLLEEFRRVKQMLSPQIA